MTPAQFDVMQTLFGSGFKPYVWGSDDAGWRIGPVYRVPTRTKKSLERQGWISVERSRIGDDGMIDWLRPTDEGRRAYIAAGGNPGPGGRNRPRRSRAR
ncbi:hypothetical protein ACFW16_32700 [Inquilinus sp. NPDC058860]|uniref:hypothetical protein n=1 Tax=Inquilinus sp. NPDC058860 TaxID=3346652 RepID=UPI00369E88A7